MSSEQVKEYVKKNGVRCLFCKSKSMYWGAVEICSGEAHQKVSCDDCGGEWLDIYKLKDVNVITEGKEETCGKVPRQQVQDEGAQHQPDNG